MGCRRENRNEAIGALSAPRMIGALTALTVAVCLFAIAGTAEARLFYGVTNHHIHSANDNLAKRKAFMPGVGSHLGDVESDGKYLYVADYGSGRDRSDPDRRQTGQHRVAGHR